MENMFDRATYILYREMDIHVSSREQGKKCASKSDRNKSSQL